MKLIAPVFALLASTCLAAEETVTEGAKQTMMVENAQLKVPAEYEWQLIKTAGADGTSTFQMKHKMTVVDKRSQNDLRDRGVYVGMKQKLTGGDEKDFTGYTVWWKPNGSPKVTCTTSFRNEWEMEINDESTICSASKDITGVNYEDKTDHYLVDFTWTTNLANGLALDFTPSVGKDLTALFEFDFDTPATSVKVALPDPSTAAAAVESGASSVAIAAATFLGVAASLY